MDKIILALMEHIRENLPEVSYIDEYYGQLEGENETNPVTFPCVLIDVEGADWTEFTPRIQSGHINLSVRLVIDCYDDTHYGSGTEDKIQVRYELYNRLHSSLQGFSPHHKMDYLNRVKSQNYTITGGLKVYETTYTFDCTEELSR